MDQAADAAGQLDEAAAALDESVRRTGEGRIEAAALHCLRADFLIGFGLRLKDRALLARAESDLAALLSGVDAARAPLTWSRAQGLRGSALCALGELTGDAAPLAQAVQVLTEAVDMVDLQHSPLDHARLSHALGLALAGLAEAVEDDGVFDHALAAFDQASAAVLDVPALALRTIVAHDRAACVAHQAGRRGDAAALARAEAVFRTELAGRNAAADPAAWAVAQIALTRVYMAQARLLGGEAVPAEAATALTEALDVFLERGLKTLAETTLQMLGTLRDG